MSLARKECATLVLGGDRAPPHRDLLVAEDDHARALEHHEQLVVERVAVRGGTPRSRPRRSCARASSGPSPARGRARARRSARGGARSRPARRRSARRSDPAAARAHRPCACAPAWCGPPGGPIMRRQPTLTLPAAEPTLNHVPRIGPPSTSNGSTDSQCTIDTRGQVFHCHMAAFRAAKNDSTPMPSDAGGMLSRARGRNRRGGCE